MNFDQWHKELLDYLAHAFDGDFSEEGRDTKNVRPMFEDGFSVEDAAEELVAEFWDNF